MFALPPEEQLVVAATHPSSNSVRLLATDQLDAARVRSAAAGNRVLPLVARFIARGNAGIDDTATGWSELAAAAKQITRRSWLRHYETLRILRRFNEAGIPVNPLKGTLLSLRTYGDATLRHSGDIDLLVQPHKLADAYVLLRECGYQLRIPAVLPDSARLTWYLNQHSNWHVVLVDRARRFRVELHWRLTPFATFPGERSGELWSRFETQRVAGVDVTSMNTPDLLLYLAYHGTKHFWHRLSWLADFANLAAQSPVAVQVARSRASNHGLSVAWETSCLLSDLWYATSLHAQPESRVQRRRVSYLVRHITLMQPTIPPSHFHFYQWNMYDSRSDSIHKSILRMVMPSYARAKSKEDYDRGLQLRRRVGKKLTTLLERWSRRR